MNFMNQTRPFPLRVLLTITTGRLLTEPKNGGNGIEDLYDILGWMTNDSPHTHQLGRFSEECKPWLLKWFPELRPASGDASLAELDARLAADRGSAVNSWLTHLRLIFKELRESYDVPRIPPESHAQKDPLAELIELTENRDGIIAIQT